MDLSHLFTQRDASTLEFSEFSTIKVSTRTIIAHTNLTIDLNKIFYLLPVYPYTILEKRRGRKKKDILIDPNVDMPYGSIITIENIDMIRGVDLKPKKRSDKKDIISSGYTINTEKNHIFNLPVNTIWKNIKTTNGSNKTKHFRNCITIIIKLDKLINFKLYINGTFQLTGCKNIEQVEECVKCIWNHIKHHTDIYSLRSDTKLNALIVPAMRNIDFPLGFCVDREKLREYIRTQTKFNFFLHPSFRYTGVNIKCPLTRDITHMELKKITNEISSDIWEESITDYQEYLNSLSAKERDNKTKRPKYITFLVFHSGKVIMSGLTTDYMRDAYNYFLLMIQDSFEQIEERLESSTSLQSISIDTTSDTVVEQKLTYVTVSQ